MDIEVILDAAEAGAPGMRELARRFPEAETRHLGVPLDAASVMARRSEGVPEVHITGAAGRLLEQLAATEPDPLNDGSAFMALARIGAQAVVMRIETETASGGTDANSSPPEMAVLVLFSARDRWLGLPRAAIYVVLAADFNDQSRQTAALSNGERQRERALSRRYLKSALECLRCSFTGP